MQFLREEAVLHKQTLCFKGKKEAPIFVHPFSAGHKGVLQKAAGVRSQKSLFPEVTGWSCTEPWGCVGRGYYHTNPEQGSIPPHLKLGMCNLGIALLCQPTAAHHPVNPGQHPQICETHTQFPGPLQECRSASGWTTSPQSSWQRRHGCSLAAHTGSPQHS